MPERCWREEDERDKAKADWDFEFQRSERLILRLYGISEQGLRSLAEQHVTYCDPLKIPFQL